MFLPFPAGERETKQAEPVVGVAPRIGFKPGVSRQQIKGLFGPHDGGNAVQPQRIGVYAAFEAAGIAYAIAPVDFDMGNLRPSLDGDEPASKVVAEIQDGVAGVKNGGVERFRHGDFPSLTESAGRQEEITRSPL